jgi:hypothetical protein
VGFFFPATRVRGGDAESIFGFIDLPGAVYRVQNFEGDNVAIVDSIDEAIPVLLASTRNIRRGGSVTVRHGTPN